MKLKEIARDLIALGSLPFFILVIARVSMLGKYFYLAQFLIAGILFFILIKIFKGNSYAGLGIISAIFITIYYQNVLFGIFAFLVYVGLVLSLYYLKNKNIAKGILFGIISSAISYYAVGIFIK